MVVCGQLCLRASFCTGFNYKTEGNQNEMNCQVTESSYEKIDVINNQAPS